MSTAGSGASCTPASPGSQQAGHCKPGGLSGQYLPAAICTRTQLNRRTGAESSVALYPRTVWPTPADLWCPRIWSSMSLSMPLAPAHVRAVRFAECNVIFAASALGSPARRKA